MHSQALALQLFSIRSRRMIESQARELGLDKIGARSLAGYGKARSPLAHLQV